MKITRKSRSVKSKYIGVVDDLFGETNIFRDYKLSRYTCFSRVYSDEIALPDYSFLTRRSSYFLEKQSMLALIASTAWHTLSLKFILK